MEVDPRAQSIEKAFEHIAKLGKKFLKEQELLTWPDSVKFDIDERDLMTKKHISLVLKWTHIKTPDEREAYRQGLKVGKEHQAFIEQHDE
jgi:hypothetical protein